MTVNGMSWTEIVDDLFTRADGSDRIAVKGWLLNRYFPQDDRDTNHLYVIDGTERYWGRWTGELCQPC